MNAKDKILAALTAKGIAHTAGDAYININDGTFGKVFLKADGSPDGCSRTTKASIVKLVNKAAQS